MVLSIWTTEEPLFGPKDIDRERKNGSGGRGRAVPKMTTAGRRRKGRVHIHISSRKPHNKATPRVEPTSSQRVVAHAATTK